MVEDELPQAVLWPHCANCGIYTHTHVHMHAHMHTRMSVHTHTQSMYVLENYRRRPELFFLSLHFPFTVNLGSIDFSHLREIQQNLRGKLRVWSSQPHEWEIRFVFHTVLRDYTSPYSGTPSRKLEERDTAPFLIQMVQWRKKDLLRCSCSRRFYFSARLHMINT